MQYIMETIIIDLVKAKRPPHPMKRAIGWWHDATEDWTDEDWLTDRDRYFSSYYFLSNYLGLLSTAPLAVLAARMIRVVRGDYSCIH